MKVLLLTVSAGEGHNSICRALTNYFDENYSGVEYKQYDLYKGRKKLINRLCGTTYFNFCKHFIGIANRNFERLKRRNVDKPSLIANFFVNNAIDFIKEKLIEFKPDAVFCAHTFAAIAMSRLREQGLDEAIKTRLITIVSDFDVAPYTEFLTKVDYIITPSDDFDQDLIRRHFDVEKQRISLGMPIHNKFSKHINKTVARKELGLDETKTTILMMNGGVGFGNNIKLIKNLNKANADFQIISVCGKNEKTKKQIDKLIASKKLKNVYNLGFATNVDVLMSASDLLVGKLGALTTSEAMCKGLPILATHKLPWQEYDNMLYLRSKGVCEYIDKNKFAYKRLEEIINNPQKLSAMQEATKNIRMPNATKDICSLIVSGTKKRQTNFI